MDDPIRFCRVPSHKLQMAAEQVCAWPDGEISWAVTAVLPGIAEAEYLACFESVYAHIAKHCGITPTMARQARNARILSGVRRIDGSGGVLAESELPCGRVKTCSQWYDLGDNWSLQKRQGTIWLWMVALHEILHALGIGHCEERGIVAVLNPTYNPALNGLQPWDIAELQKRYGPPRLAPTPPIPTPTPTPTPAPPAEGGFMGNLATLLKLATALGPLLSWLANNQQSLTTILDVLKKIADAFGKQPVKAALLGVNVSKEQLKEVLSKTAGVLVVGAAMTPTTADDAVAAVLVQAVDTPWLLDLLYWVLTGQLGITEPLLAQALAEVQLETTPTV